MSVPAASAVATTFTTHHQSNLSVMGRGEEGGGVGEKARHQ